MITKDSIETAYSFLHQKYNVYLYSKLDWQRDDIEYAIGDYVDGMNQALYQKIAQGCPDFLKDHEHFLEHISRAVDRLEEMLSCPDTL